VPQVSIREIGDVRAVIKIDSLGRKRLSRQIHVTGARTAKPTARIIRSGGNVTKIKNMQRAVRRVCGRGPEDRQSSHQQAQNELRVFHSDMSSVFQNVDVAPSPGLATTSRLCCDSRLAGSDPADAVLDERDEIR